MSRAEEIRKTAQKTRARRGPEAAAGEPASPGAELKPVRSVPQVKTKRVRRTVDLTANRHRELDRWADEKADELGYTRVTSQDVLAALVDELLSDAQLQRAVGERIRRART